MTGLKEFDIGTVLQGKELENFLLSGIEEKEELIMYVLDKLDYAEQRGLGFETVKDLPSKDLPLPKVQYNAPYIEFVLPLTMEVAETVYSDLLEKEIEVLEYIRVKGLTSSADIQKHFDLEQKLVSRIVTKLKEKKLFCFRRTDSKYGL